MPTPGNERDWQRITLRTSKQTEKKGTELRFSAGLKVSATATDTPTDNRLMVIGNRNHLILGVRDGVESALSDEARWDTDEIELKMRARRGFAAATADAFRVIEITPTV